MVFNKGEVENTDFTYFQKLMSLLPSQCLFYNSDYTEDVTVLH